MKAYLGWVQGSAMAATYVHLSGRDVDNAILAMHGLQSPEQRREPAVLRCLRCSTENPFATTYCSLCGLPLDEREATRALADAGRSELAEKVAGLLSDAPESRDAIWRVAEFLSTARPSASAHARGTGRAVIPERHEAAERGR